MLPLTSVVTQIAGKSPVRNATVTVVDQPQDLENRKCKRREDLAKTVEDPIDLTEKEAPIGETGNAHVVASFTTPVGMPVSQKDTAIRVAHITASVMNNVVLLVDVKVLSKMVFEETMKLVVEAGYNVSSLLMVVHLLYLVSH